VGIKPSFESEKKVRWMNTQMDEFPKRKEVFGDIIRWVKMIKPI